MEVLRIQELRKALETKKGDFAKGYQKGVKRAGLYLQRKSMEIVPVHLGPLRESAFTRHTGHGFKTIVIVGYTAAYAVFVHENPKAAHGTEFNLKHAGKIASAHTPAQKKMWFNRGENQQYKFLEKPARANGKKIVKIVVEDMSQAT